MPTLPPVGEIKRGVDADHIAVEVEHRAARIARIDRGVGLDVAVVEAGADVAVQRRDDAGGDGAAEAERIADRDHPVADPGPGRIAEADEGQAAASA